MSDPAWFVYLFALTDCSAFKVGFSCNPFQRIHAFCRRYYERFDRRGSRCCCASAAKPTRARSRRLLKSELAAFRTDSPVLGAPGSRRSDRMVQRRGARPCRGTTALVPRRARDRAGDRCGRVLPQRARALSGSFEPLGAGARRSRCATRRRPLTRRARRWRSPTLARSRRRPGCDANAGRCSLGRRPRQVRDDAEVPTETCRGQQRLDEQLGPITCAARWRPTASSRSSRASRSAKATTAFLQRHGRRGEMAQ